MKLRLQKTYTRKVIKERIRTKGLEATTRFWGKEPDGRVIGGNCGRRFLTDAETRQLPEVRDYEVIEIDEPTQISEDVTIPKNAKSIVALNFPNRQRLAVYRTEHDTRLASMTDGSWRQEKPHTFYQISTIIDTDSPVDLDKYCN